MKEEWKKNPELMPREKALARGFSALSEEELLAIILRTGRKGATVLELSEEVLQVRKSCKGLTGLMHYSVQELTKVPGIGMAKAIELLAIVTASVPCGMEKTGNRINCEKNLEFQCA